MCTGYLKSWPLTQVQVGGAGCGAADPCDDDSALSCLVAIGRPQPSYQPTITDCLDRGQEREHGVEFHSKHAADGKFTWSDQRVSLILGYTPQELLSTSLYEHIHYDDIPTVAECHKEVLKKPGEEILTPCFRAKAKDGRLLTLETKMKQFKNPWTKELEFIVCKHCVVISDQKYQECPGLNNADNNQIHQNQQHLEYKGILFVYLWTREINELSPSSCLDLTQIGRKIAEECTGKSKEDSVVAPKIAPKGQTPEHKKMMSDAMVDIEKDRLLLTGDISQG